jgi:hypothetical protein
MNGNTFGVHNKPGIPRTILLKYQVYTMYSFFLNYTVYRRHSKRMHTHLYEHTYANPTPLKTFKGLS